MKTKMKKKTGFTLLGIIALTVVLVSLSACGEASPQDITGKWYNYDAVCLDIRSDGTYEIEGSYGTGTWKYLDDGETIEFIDFYGESNKSKVEKDSKGEYIRISTYGNFYRKTTEEKENDSEKPSVKLLKNGEFSDGVAWIMYNDQSGAKQVALINTEGKILYKQAYSSTILPEKMSGIGYIKDRDGFYKLITPEGKIVATSEGGAFDEILAFHEGTALVYKYSGPKNEKHQYGVIDATGNFVVDYIEMSRKYTASSKGCGMYSIDMSPANYDALISVKEGRCVYIAKEEIPEFVNDYAYFHCHYVSETPFSDSQVFWDEDAMHYFIMDTSFNITSVKKTLEGYKYLGLYDGVIVALSENPMVIIDPIENKEYSLGYNHNQMEFLRYFGDLGLLRIQGSDGNKYFTLVDRKGVEQFEPVKYSTAPNYSDGIVVYGVGSTWGTDNKRAIIDAKGNVLVQETEDYKYIGDFCDGIAPATTTFDENVYINTKGEIILQNIHE